MAQPQWTAVLEHSLSTSLTLTGVCIVALLLFTYRWQPKVKAPCVGYRSAWEPTVWVKLRFFKGAHDIVAEGYNKAMIPCLTWACANSSPVQRWHVLGSSQRYRSLGHFEQICR